MKYDIRLASKLLEFKGKGVPDYTAATQLEGAVAIANILDTQGVAYLADEVGMGKTYVAMGALALIRHLKPDIRVAIIAPRGNIQEKWMKEMKQFSKNNVRFADLRNQGLNGGSSRKQVKISSLFDFVREVSIDPDRDFFLRLGSFSLSASVEEGEMVTAESQERLLNRLRDVLPFVKVERFARGTKDVLKKRVATEINKVLPYFDLLIVDEGHNLKHGLKKGTAARNHTLNAVFKGKVGSVLFLSATPVEQSYGHLFGQLEVFDKGDNFTSLKDGAVKPGTSTVLTEAEKHECARQFLIRRTYSISVAGQALTRNMYRLEWRHGGLTEHDEPLGRPTLKQYLATALVQKNVSTVLRTRFGNAFQTGLLASFESFEETLENVLDVKGNVESSDSSEIFDGAEQTNDSRVKNGADVGVVNAITRSHRDRFHTELPHPKMDALVDHLTSRFHTGEKALVFVRRIAWVREIKPRLDEHYNEFIIGRMRAELRVYSKSISRFNKCVEEYYENLLKRKRHRTPDIDIEKLSEVEKADPGGINTFFEWYFRGEGPSDVFSGATLNKRFRSTTGVYATFFELNYCSYVLEVPASGVLSRLAELLSLGEDELVQRVKDKARTVRKRGSNSDERTRQAQFEAVQYAALIELRDSHNKESQIASVLLNVRFEGYTHGDGSNPVDIDVKRWLEMPTYFSELMNDTELCSELWGADVVRADTDAKCEMLLRKMSVLSTTSRLGHAFVDLYLCVARYRSSIRIRTRASHGDDVDDQKSDDKLVRSWLEELRRQKTDELHGKGGFRAYHELREVASNLDSIIDLNLDDLGSQSPIAYDRVTARTLGEQMPVAGMYGRINRRVVKQFRMPGYPFVLVTTDLLQEGEDLHLFCARIYHYGIGWMPSSMEQRIGRVDRVRSLTERRLTRMSDQIVDAAKIQVYYPYLKETYETLQVKRVFERMNAFHQMMHETAVRNDSGSEIVVTAQSLADLQIPPAITEPLKSAFPVSRELLHGTERTLKESGSKAKALAKRFAAICRELKKLQQVEWDLHPEPYRYRGVVNLENGRREDIILTMETEHDQVYVTCRSIIYDGPVHKLQNGWRTILSHPELKHVIVRKSLKQEAIQLRSIGEVLLGNDSFDVERVLWCIERVTRAADDVEREIIRTDEEHDGATYDE